MESLQLHGFSDASQQAYAGVALNHGATCIMTPLVIAKTRVSPVKRLIIPHLEVCGVHWFLHDSSTTTMKFFIYIHYRFMPGQTVQSCSIGLQEVHATS